MAREQREGGGEREVSCVERFRNEEIAHHQTKRLLKVYFVDDRQKLLSWKRLISRINECHKILMSFCTQERESVKSFFFLHHELLAQFMK
jgi:hypothetical protein